LEQIGNKYGFDTSRYTGLVFNSAMAYYPGAKYEPAKGEQYRDDYLKAVSICNKVLAQKDSSEGKINCANLMNEITRNEVNLQTEKVNVPGQPFRTLVSWRNFTKLNFRLIKMDAKTREALGTNNWDDEYWKKLLKLSAVKTFNQSLPDTKDYQRHATEIKVDALPVGEYALLASVDDKFP
jgi:hypothetical protein